MKATTEDSRGVLFLDPLAPHPYDHTTCERRGMGGTELMVARVAAGLARRVDHRPVRVAQGRRGSPKLAGGVVWRPTAPDGLAPDRLRAAWGGGAPPSTVVIVQAWKLARLVREAFPRARVLVWLHTFPGRRAGGRLGTLLERADARLVAVSDVHLDDVRVRLAAHVGAEVARKRTLRIHNGVEDDLRPDDTPRDPNLLICLSSPHKGQREVLDAFVAARRRMPELRLLVADPGYWGSEPAPLPAGARRIGSLSRPEVLALLRRTACLFYPQASFAETFGLVFAEALAVGTPVVAHPLGAAPEVLPESCLVDCREPEAVAERLERWRAEGAPAVSLRAELRLSAVLDDWGALLGGRPSQPSTERDASASEDTSTVPNRPPLSSLPTNGTRYRPTGSSTASPPTTPVATAAASPSSTSYLELTTTE